MLRLAQARFEEAGLGAELYPSTPEQLGQQQPFLPAGRPCTVHLPRGINLLQPEGRDRVLEFAVRCAGRAHGMIVHDQAQFGERPDAAVAALQEVDQRLARMSSAPLLFVEYAAGLPPADFAVLFERTRELAYVSACVDISHVGIQVCRTVYGAAFPGVDICSLRTSPDLPHQLEQVQAAVAQARPAVVGLVQRLARLGKPLHFHLHDGHPFSTLSRYGVADHLSFFQEIRLPFAYQGRQLLGGLFGPAGLREVVRTALRSLPAEQLSFMLEIHPQEGRTPLGVHAPLFAHWKDKTSAERMNYWLDMLLQNAVLLREAVGRPSPEARPQAAEAI